MSLAEYVLENNERSITNTFFFHPTLIIYIGHRYTGKRILVFRDRSDCNQNIIIGTKSQSIISHNHYYTKIYFIVLNRVLFVNDYYRLIGNNMLKNLILYRQRHVFYSFKYVMIYVSFKCLFYIFILISKLVDTSR